MLFKDVEKLVKLIENSAFDEFEWEKNKERIKLKKSPSGMSTVSYAPAPAPAVAAPGPIVGTSAPTATGAAQTAAESASEQPSAKAGKEVLSPFVGTFYSSPAPDSPPYVEIGKTVKKGDVLCIVEAMKIMNEIEAEFAGKVIEILATNGQAVQYGEPLFVIDPN